MTLPQARERCLGKEWEQNWKAKRLTVDDIDRLLGEIAQAVSTDAPTWEKISAIGAAARGALVRQR